MVIKTLEPSNQFNNLAFKKFWKKNWGEKKMGWKKKIGWKKNGGEKKMGRKKNLWKKKFWKKKIGVHKKKILKKKFFIGPVPQVEVEVWKEI